MGDEQEEQVELKIVDVKEVFFSCDYIKLDSPEEFTKVVDVNVIVYRTPNGSLYQQFEGFYIVLVSEEEKVDTNYC